jgi:hypothetical protein
MLMLEKINCKNIINNHCKKSSEFGSHGSTCNCGFYIYVGTHIYIYICRDIIVSKRDTSVRI